LVTGPATPEVPSDPRTPDGQQWPSVV